MKWFKYFIAFLSGAFVSGIFMANILVFSIQGNLENVIKNHIYMLERFDKGEKPYSRILLLANVRIMAQDLEKMIKTEPFANCSDSAKEILINARKYSDEVSICE